MCAFWPCDVWHDELHGNTRELSILVTSHRIGEQIALGLQHHVGMLDRIADIGGTQGLGVERGCGRVSQYAFTISVLKGVAKRVAGVLIFCAEITGHAVVDG